MFGMPPGTYTGTTGNYVCVSCKAGFHQPQYAASKCEQCQAGTYTPTGRASCLTCDNGKVQPNMGSIACDT
jgi:hypothetical protein